MTARVSDLSVDELRFLIQETMRQAFEELFRDPDSGVDLRPDFKSELTNSLQSIQKGGKMHPKAQLCGVSGTSPRTRATWAYANCDGTGFTAFDGDTDDGLSSGECVTEEIKTDDNEAEMPPGRYVMYFIANGETKVPESDYSNNVSAKVFVVE